MTLPQRASQLAITDFRNIAHLELEPAARLNVISGDNGQGKTSVLEALYVLCTSKSFRTERLEEVRREGSSFTRVLGVFIEGDVSRRQRAILAPGERKLLIDDKPPERLSAYAVRTPVVVFHPGDLGLVAGGASMRRRLLDRIALFTDPSTGDVRTSYQRAQKERQSVLQRRDGNAPELDVFERLMARFGVLIHRARARAAAALGAAIHPVFASMAANDLVLELAYAPAGTDEEEPFVRELHRRRAGDRRRRSPDYGPQRDDLLLTINGRSARHHASQGQQRVLTLALKLAELGCIRDARGSEPLLLLDDVSSELDPKRIGAVYDVLQSGRSQVFVTTTRPELFDVASFSSADRRDFRLRGGALDSAG